MSKLLENLSPFGMGNFGPSICFAPDEGAGGDAGGDAGRDAGGDAGRDAGGDAGGDTGGDTGGDAGGDAGGDTGGAAEPTWRDNLGAGLSDNPSLEKFSDVASLAKSYLNAEKMIGRDKIPMPQTAEEFTSVFKRLGMPDTADEYKLTPPKDIPAGFNYPPEAEKDFRNMVHDLELTQAQAEKLYNNIWVSQLKNFAGHNESVSHMKADCNKTLEQAWGNDVEPQMNIAMQAAEKLFSPETVEMMKETFGNSASLLMDLNKLGTNLVEDGVLTGAGANTGITPQQLVHKVEELMGHPAYLDKHHVEHKSIVDQVYSLRQKQNGGK